MALFQRGEFFEAHEVWEDLWMQASGSQRIFLQALIQLAAARLKHEEGTRGGAARLARAARAKLGAVAEDERLSPRGRYMGVVVARLRASLERGPGAHVRVDVSGD